jgi:hypothetical protein
MATARSSQAHQKRVQKIAEDAASAIAADSPLEEEVVVVVEESPPGEAASTSRSRATEGSRAGAETAVGMVAQAQQFMADSITRWIDLTSTTRSGSSTSLDSRVGQFDPRRLTEESFRFAEELLESQKQFALRLADAMTPVASA